MNTIVGLINTKEFWMNVAYVFSIALQVSAGLLLIGNTATKREGIIKAYCATNRGIGFYEDGTLADFSGLMDVIRATWINKIAFIYLFAGYLVGIFGDAPIDREIALITVLMLMIPLGGIPYKITKYKIQKFGTINKDDLSDKNGVIIAMLDNNTYNTK